MSNEKAEIVPPVALLRWAFGLGILVDVGMFVHSGWITGLIAWAGIGLVGVVFMDRIANFIVRIPDRVTRRVLLVGAIVVSAIIVVLYPLANALVIPGAHERDELIKGGLSYLFSGRNIYEFQLSARAPISPFPSWVLLNIPFYLLGKLTPHDALFAVQNIAVFAVVYAVWRRVITTEVATYSLFLLCISLMLPNITYELIAGSDYLADALMASAMSATAVVARDRIAKNPWLMALTGMVLISRLHFGLLFSPITG
jgi:hypothetical protein